MPLRVLDYVLVIAKHFSSSCGADGLLSGINRHFLTAPNHNDFVDVRVTKLIVREAGS
jgi:hypothetical protein